MTWQQALAFCTANNVYAAFEEELKGSLALGKLADITVLSEFVLTIPDDEVPGTEVVYTIIGGGIQFQKGRLT